MFPPASAQVYYNDAGEVLGWDIPSDDEYFEEHLYDLNIDPDNESDDDWEDESDDS